MTSFHTATLHQLIDQFQAGTPGSQDELLRRVGKRLETLARKMLRRFPNVARWEDTGDVLQNASMRLLKTLENVKPASVRDFFGLAAVHMRWELLDLARHYRGGRGLAPAQPGSGQGEIPLELTATQAPDLENWSSFHRAVEILPAEQREVFSLVFYHGWTQAEIANLFQVNERTVRRRWHTACLQLHAALQGCLPEL